MELTKEQIKDIDYKIEQYGVEYWDVRIELLDHVVSFIESNLEKKEDYKKTLHKAFLSVGWQGGFKHLNTLAWKNTNKFYRKIYLKGFIDFFRKKSNIFIFIVCFICYYIASELLNLKTFVTISYILFLIPSLIFFYESFITWRKKYGKSVHKQYGLHYIITTTLILQIIPMSLKDSGLFTIPSDYHKIILFILIPCHLIFTLSGYKVYKKAISKVENMRKELLL